MKIYQNFGPYGNKNTLLKQSVWNVYKIIGVMLHIQIK